MKDKIEMQILEPFKGCHNPVKCYYPTVEHDYCTSNSITTTKSVDIKVSYFGVEESE